jgi:hypothetical protein
VFNLVVDRYNWLGNSETKKTYDIGQNLARNLPGALLQDYLIHLMIRLCEPYPSLDVFSEVKVSFGRYALWKHGAVAYKTPSEKSDLAVGYLMENNEIKPPADPWPRQAYLKLAANQAVQPLITVNTKIRVSQSEFFDWLGREQLMTKGNPHCMSVQVALRKEMDYDIVEAAQATGKFFLLGSGGETTVTPDTDELLRFINTVGLHLTTRMGDPPAGVPGPPL